MSTIVDQPIPRGAIKRFREHLNQAHPVALPSDRGRVNGGPMRGALARPYGDYLYAQDREKFMVDLREWLAENHS